LDLGNVSEGKELPQPLTLNPLTWKIWLDPNNASRWEVGFNSAFKGLNDIYEWHIRRQYIIFNNNQSAYTVRISLNKGKYEPWTHLYPFVKVGECILLKVSISNFSTLLSIV